MTAAIRINLLDWRAEAREAKRRRFIGVLIGVAVATLVVVGVLPRLYFDHQLDLQQARNRYLQRQIDQAEHQLVEIRTLKKTRTALVNRMHIIGDLQRSRSAIVHYFDQLVATLPDGVYLTGLAQNGDMTTLDGIAESNARVSQYMTNLDESAWFDDPRLVVIKRDRENGQSRADFTLQVNQAGPVTPTPGTEAPS